jgi:hypothetical protein
VYRLGTCLLLACPAAHPVEARADRRQDRGGRQRRRRAPEQDTSAAFVHLGATDRAAVLETLCDAHLPDRWKG